MATASFPHLTEGAVANSITWKLPNFLNISRFHHRVVYRSKTCIKTYDIPVSKLNNPELEQECRTASPQASDSR